MIQIIIFFVISTFKIINCSISNSFNSNYFNSNYFNSNKLTSSFENTLKNSYLSVLPNSYKFSESSKHYYSLSKLYLTESTKNSYLSILPNSYKPSESSKHYYSLSKSYLTKSTKNSYLSVLPNSYKPFESSKHYYSLSTMSSTLAPTLAPTLVPSVIIDYTNPTMSFETIMTLNGLSEPILDDKSQTALINTIAYSTNISSKFVFLKSQTYTSNRKLLPIKLLSTYDVSAITEIIIPLIGKYNINPTTLYSNLVTNLKNSLDSGNFATYLHSESVLLGSTSLLNVSINNYVVSQLTLINVTTQYPTLYPTNIVGGEITPNLPQKEILLIIGISICGFLCVLLCFLFKKYKFNTLSFNNNFNITSNDEPINTENIVISIDHNE